MSQELIDFLYELAQTTDTASLPYPRNAGSLPPAVLEADVNTLTGLALDGLLYIRKHMYDGRENLAAVRVELTGPGRQWALQLKNP
jgi:hypothetical protein